MTDNQSTLEGYIRQYDITLATVQYSFRSYLYWRCSNGKYNYIDMGITDDYMGLTLEKETWRSSGWELCGCFRFVDNGLAVPSVDYMFVRQSVLGVMRADNNYISNRAFMYELMLMGLVKAIHEHESKRRE